MQKILAHNDSWLDQINQKIATMIGCVLIFVSIILADNINES